MYGSLAQGLALGDSDIDLTIINLDCYHQKSKEIFYLDFFYQALI